MFPENATNAKDIENYSMKLLAFIIVNLGVAFCSMHFNLPPFKGLKNQLRENYGRYPYDGSHPPPPMNSHNSFSPMPNLPLYPNNPSVGGYGNPSANFYDNAYGQSGFPDGMYPQSQFGSPELYPGQSSYLQSPIPPSNFPGTYGGYPSFPNQAPDYYQMNLFRPKPQHYHF